MRQVDPAEAPRNARPDGAVTQYRGDAKGINYHLINVGDGSTGRPARAIPR